MDYVGWDNTTTVPLDIRHNGSEEIRFYTDNRIRLNLNPDRTNTFGSFTVQTNGFLGLGSIIWPNTAPLVPWTRFHMQDDRVAYYPGMQNCFRDWMRNGHTMTSVYDQFYVGQMAWDDQDLHGPAHAVFQWGKKNPNDTRPSLARFIYAGEYTGTASGEQSRFGKELMQLHPEGYIGLGDWNAASVAAGSTVSPGERLDLLDGKVRIRQLPADPTSASTELVTVNMTTGVLEHKPAAALPDNCEWAFDSPSTYNVVTATGSASGCPGDDNSVWIGGAAAGTKLFVQSKLAAVSPIGIQALSLANATTTGSMTGILGTAMENGGHAAGQHYGVMGRASNGTTSNTGLHGNASGGQRSYGIETLAQGGSAANVGGSMAAIGGTDCAGVSTSAKNASSTNTGIYASASGSGAITNIGGKFPSVGGQTCYGIYASASGGTTTNYAGYFAGTAYATVNFTTSDEHLKSDIQDLEGALNTVMQLRPKTYDFRTTEYPGMHLPTGRQAGVIAQDLEEVLPTLVADAVQPAEQDEEGNETTAAVDFKAVNMAGLIPYLIGAIQEQQARIEVLTAEMEQCCAAGRTNGTRSCVQDAAMTSPSTEQLTIAPNPFTDRTVLTYTLATPGRARLEVGNTEGRRLSVLREEQARAGTFRYEWDTQALAAGTYLVTLLVDDRVMMKKAVKVAR